MVIVDKLDAIEDAFMRKMLSLGFNNAEIEYSQDCDCYVINLNAETIPLDIEIQNIFCYGNISPLRFDRDVIIRNDQGDTDSSNFFRMFSGDFREEYDFITLINNRVNPWISTNIEGIAHSIREGEGQNSYMLRFQERIDQDLRIELEQLLEESFPFLDITISDRRREPTSHEEAAYMRMVDIMDLQVEVNNWSIINMVDPIMFRVILREDSEITLRIASSRLTDDHSLRSRFESYLREGFPHLTITFETENIDYLSSNSSSSASPPPYQTSYSEEVHSLSGVSPEEQSDSALL